MRTFSTPFLVFAALWLGGHSLGAGGEPSVLEKRALSEWTSTVPDQIEKSWDESTRTLTIRQKVDQAVLTLADTELGDYLIQFRSDLPESQMLVRIATGKPTKIPLISADPGQKVILINPKGILVGSDPPTFPREDPTRFSTLEPAFDQTAGEVGASGTATGPELVAKGNVHALAINRDGVIRTTTPGRVTVTPSAAGKTLDLGALSIVQASEFSLMNWTDWSVAPQSVTRVDQPSKNSVALFRIAKRPANFVLPKIEAIGAVFLDNEDGTVTRLNEPGHGRVLDWDDAGLPAEARNPNRTE